MSRPRWRSVAIFVLLNVLVHVNAEDSVNSIAEDHEFHINLDAGDEPVEPLPVGAVIREIVYGAPSKKATEDVKEDKETPATNFNEILSRSKRQINFGGK